MKKTKQGLDFYPIDVNFLSDYSVQVLIEEFGLQSVAVLMELFSEIYRQEGYFLRVDDKLILITAKFLSIPKEELKKMIDYAVDCGIFDKKLFKKHKILTSFFIQKNFAFASKRRKGSSICPKYNLLQNHKCIHDAYKNAYKNAHTNTNNNTNTNKDNIVDVVVDVETATSKKSTTTGLTKKRLCHEADQKVAYSSSRIGYLKSTSDRDPNKLALKKLFGQPHPLLFAGDCGSSPQ